MITSGSSQNTFGHVKCLDPQNLDHDTKAPKKTDILDKLGKDGKLTPQERQRCFDNKLCLVCDQGGHIATACLKAKPHTAKASLGKASEAPAESMAKASEAKNEQPSHSHAFQGLC